MHEDFEETIKDKYWIPRYFRSAVSLLYSVYLKILIMIFLDEIIVTTPLIENKFKKYDKVDVIENYAPIIEVDYKKVEIPWDIENVIIENRENLKIVFTGLINKQRGILEVVEALKYNRLAVLFLIGACSEGFKDEIYMLVEQFSLDKQVFIFDSVEYHQMLKIISEMDVGILPYLPYGNHKVTRPNKLFEYMLCEKPVIASNFPLYSEVINQGIGYTFDPVSPLAIANAMKQLEDNATREICGKKGRRLYLKKYNWSVEEKKLFSIYENLLNK